MSNMILEKFQHAFVSPHDEARAWKEKTGGRVVGYIGADVPAELIHAAGMLPVRILGCPGAPTHNIAPYVGEGVDPGAKSIAERLIDGTYDYVDHLVVCTAPVIYSSLYDFLLESRRVHGDIGLPTPVLFDFLRSNSLTASLFNRETLRRFRQQLSEWSGEPVDDIKLHNSIECYNQQRTLIKCINDCRFGEAPTIKGSDALAINATSFSLPVELHTEWCREVLDSDLPTLNGTPVIYSGSNTENINTYLALENAGAQIVADDQELGSSAVVNGVENTTNDAIDGLCDRIQMSYPRATGGLVKDRAAYLTELAHTTAAEGVIFHILAIDHPAALDYPRLRDRLAAADIPSVECGERLYSESDFSPISEICQTFITNLTSRGNC